ncbi:hypothetical protein CKAH01_04258 [Colletotrichum kahawae]|uniref:Uncharacterized protein n=1 Tax=Colletotrichum kahawae TaxID=34407 RepID=A0AAD9YJR2_COLKA|nr:hypothetical protein CKAH01_04258 [Colletotrichum kahawae]
MLHDPSPTASPQQPMILVFVRHSAAAKDGKADAKFHRALSRLALALVSFTVFRNAATSVLLSAACPTQPALRDDATLQEATASTDESAPVKGILDGCRVLMMMAGLVCCHSPDSKIIVVLTSSASVVPRRCCGTERTTWAILCAADWTADCGLWITLRQPRGWLSTYRHRYDDGSTEAGDHGNIRELGLLWARISLSGPNRIAALAESLGLLSSAIVESVAKTDVRCGWSGSPLRCALGWPDEKR